MPERIRVREVSAAVTAVIESLARSRTEAVRKVQRAKIVWLPQEGKTVAVIAAELRRDPDTVRAWLKRFNTLGLAGLEDAARSGWPQTYTADEVEEMVAAALTNPQSRDGYRLPGN